MDEGNLIITVILVLTAVLCLFMGRKNAHCCGAKPTSQSHTPKKKE